MVNNLDRAAWAKAAIQTFADKCLSSKLSEDAVVDLVCDLGHFAELLLCARKRDVLKLFETGIGAWLAESNHPLDEPMDNEVVTINTTLDHFGEQPTRS